MLGLHRPQPALVVFRYEVDARVRCPHVPATRPRARHEYNCRRYSGDVLQASTCTVARSRGHPDATTPRAVPAARADYLLDGPSSRAPFPHGELPALSARRTPGTRCPPHLRGDRDAALRTRPGPRSRYETRSRRPGGRAAASPRPHRGAQAGGRGLADELLRSLIGGEAEELGGRNALGESSGLPTRDLSSEQRRSNFRDRPLWPVSSSCFGCSRSSWRRRNASAKARRSAAASASAWGGSSSAVSVAALPLAGSCGRLR